jgi:hypothetical protein
MSTQSRTEEHRTRGERLVEKVRELIHAGNVRRLIIRNDDGKTLIEVPLTVGAVGMLLAPAWAAIAAIAAVVADCSIVVERDEEPQEQDATPLAGVNAAPEPAAVHPPGYEPVDTEC